MESIDRILSEAPSPANGALELNRMCSARVTASGAATGEPLEPMDMEADAVSSEEDDTDGDTVLDDPLVFQPPYILGEWEDDGEDRRIYIAILMPSGTSHSTADHGVKVVRGGRALQVFVQWPTALTDRLSLHRAWLKESSFTKYHPHILSFRGFLGRLRSKSTDTITSVYNIKLPFKVKEELSVGQDNTKYLRWIGSTEIILYVTLHAPDRDFVQAPESSPHFMIA